MNTCWHHKWIWQRMLIFGNTEGNEMKSIQNDLAPTDSVVHYLVQ